MDEIPIENVNISNTSIFNTTNETNASIYGRHLSDIIEIDEPKYLNNVTPLYLPMEELNFDPTEVIFTASNLQVEYIDDIFYIDNACFTAYEDGKFIPFTVHDWTGDKPIVINMELDGRYLKFTTNNDEINIIFNPNDDLTYMNGLLPNVCIGREYLYEAYARQPIEPLKDVDQISIVNNLGVMYSDIEIMNHFDMIGLNNMNKDLIDVFYICEYNGDMKIVKGEFFDDEEYDSLGSSILNTRVSDAEFKPIGMTWVAFVNKYDNGHGSIYMVSEPFKSIYDPIQSGEVIVNEGGNIDENSYSRLCEIYNDVKQDSGSIGVLNSDNKYQIDVIISNAPCNFDGI